MYRQGIPRTDRAREMRLITATHKKRQEILLADEIAYNQALHDHFDIMLQGSVWQID